MNAGYLHDVDYLLRHNSVSDRRRMNPVKREQPTANPAFRACSKEFRVRTWHQVPQRRWQFIRSPPPGPGCRRINLAAGRKPVEQPSDIEQIPISFWPSIGPLPRVLYRLGNRLIVLVDSAIDCARLSRCNVRIIGWIKCRIE